MQNVIQYCVPGNLTELDIEIKKACKVLWDSFKKNVSDHGCLEQARPILHRLEKLSLTNESMQLDAIFVLYRRDLPNLKSLTLKRFRFLHKGWTDIFPNELSNVTELRLTHVHLIENLSEFELFLNQFTNLQVFVHIRTNIINPQPEAIADCLYRRFPQLKGFGFNSDLYPDDTTINYQRSTFSIGNRFSFLEKFTHLSEIHVAHFLAPKPRDIHSIIQFVPNLKILSVVEIIFFQPPVAVRRMKQSIERAIDRRRDRFPRNDRVHIIVNKMQYRDFMALKNVNEIIRLSIDWNHTAFPMGM